MIAFIKIRETAAAAGLKKREVNKRLKRTWGSTGKYWHARFSGKHFTQRGAREYGYARRKRRYTARKKKKFGHTRPLVYSGETMRGTRTRTIRATRHGVRVSLPKTQALNFRPKGGRINMRQEMQTVSSREEKLIGRHIEKTLTRQMKKGGASKTRRPR